MKTRLLLIIPCLLTACTATDYRGPSIGFSVGWNGVDVGIRLYSSDKPAEPKVELPALEKPVIVQK